jgi:hypothetical protein
MTAGQDLHLDITESTRIHVHEQDAIIHIDSGNLIIEADGDITLEGDGKGTILFEQNGGGFSMAPNGDITIFGDEISLEADEINFYGPVNKEITAPPAAPVAKELAPLTVRVISELTTITTDEGAVETLENLTLNLHDFFGNDLDGHFADLQGRPWQFVSDCGDERSGVVDGHVVQINGVRFEQNFQFGIEGIEITYTEAEGK